MDDHQIAGLRMHNQYISNPEFTRPQDVVKKMVAMQAQDYAGAKWAIGLRMQNANDDLIENAITNGEILRTHLLRPTWHFVSPHDIGWILSLTAPRVNAINAGMYKKFELDKNIFNKSNHIFTEALKDNRQLTRPELTAELNKNNIPTDDLRFTLLLMHAELDSIICSGGRIGKQFTYALLADRAPNALVLTNEEALHRLATGFFNTRGPATVHDFANWSGLTVADAELGLQYIKETLIGEKIEGKTYWMPDNATNIQVNSKAYLLPAYDEFAIAYKNRDALVKPKYREQARYLIFNPVIVIDNQVVGNWRRTIKTNSIDISCQLFDKLNTGQAKVLEVVEKRYRKFLCK